MSGGRDAHAMSIPHDSSMTEFATRHGLSLNVGRGGWSFNDDLSNTVQCGNRLVASLMINGDAAKFGRGRRASFA